MEEKAKCIFQDYVHLDDDYALYLCTNCEHMFSVEFDDSFMGDIVACPCCGARFDDEEN